MKKYCNAKYNNSILKKLLLAMLAVQAVQVFVIISMFLHTEILKKSVENECTILSEKVLNRKLYIENEMKTRWTAFDDVQEKIIRIIKSELQKSNRSVNKLSQDYGIQNRIIHEIFPSILYLLRKNSVTGAFIILDAPFLDPHLKNLSNADFLYPGLYLRTSEPGCYSEKNNDLVISVGTIPILKDFNIAMDMDWRPFFVMSDTLNQKNTVFFNAPINAAKRKLSKNGKDLCYWSPPFNFTSKNKKVITYSVPLIDDEGIIYGVMGIDLSESYLKSLLYSDELHTDKNGIYSFAIRNAENNFTTFFTKGKLEQEEPVSHLITLQTEFPNTHFIKNYGSNSTPYYAAVHAFNLYPRNGMFTKQEWVLMGFVPQTSLTAISTRIGKAFVQVLAVSVTLFVIGAYLSSKNISNTLNKVVQKLETSDKTKPIKIEKMNITEIDILISAIENLSVEVFNRASKVSRIVEQLKIPIGVFEYNTFLGTVFCNSILFKLFNITKYNEDTVLTYQEFHSFIKELDRFIDSQNETRTIYAIPTAEYGKVRWIKFTSTEESKYVFGLALDITKETEERKRLEFQMKYDELTGLYNKTSFDKKMNEIFKQNNLGICALLHWDIDNLKYINTTFGHSYGDTYLQMFGKKLAQLQQDRCIVCRRSADEFNSFFYNFSTVDEIRLLINSFWKKIEEETITLPNNEETKLRVSAGLAWYPNDADNQSDLIRYADFAMYDAKHSFKGALHEFDINVYKKDYILVQGTEAINKLIENKLIEYALQPIVVASTGEIYGYEMLMRAKMQEFKNPEDILRLAKAQSKLHLLESLTLFTAMETFVNKIANNEIKKTAKVFLNTINSQILTAEKTLEFEKKFGPYLSNIVLELSESEPLNMNFFSIKSDIIQKWKAMIAIDDFGSGYSNDSSLIFLSPNLIKIDMSIVRDVHKNIDKQNILENLISYAKKRNIIVLAEGVEVREEMDVLLRFGVDLFQGYFFAKPSTAVSDIPKDRLDILREMYKSYHREKINNIDGKS